MPYILSYTNELQMTQDELLSYCYKNEIIWTIEEFENLISLVKNGSISSIQELSEYEMIDEDTRRTELKQI